MNIYLIHGENHIQAYERLQDYINKARENSWEIVEIEDKDNNLITKLRSEDLFGRKRLIVSKSYTPFDKKVIEFVNKSDLPLEIVIFHKGTIPITFTKKLSGVKKNENYKLSKSLWNFIDSFYPNNAKKCLALLDETVKNDPIELVFSLLIGQIRDMFFILNGERLNYPPWRLGKLSAQANKFTKENISSLIEDLAKIDVKSKTSDTSLKDELDLFIATKLE